MTLYNELDGRHDMSSSPNGCTRCTFDKALKKSGLRYALQIDAETARRIKPSLTALLVCLLKPQVSSCRYLKDCDKLTYDVVARASDDAYARRAIWKFIRCGKT
jgi:hypothetical protein